MLTPKAFLLLLLMSLTGALSAAAQCRDPWLNQIYQQVYNRKPVGTGESCECNTKLYNNASWNNYNELVGYVKQVQGGLRFGYAPLGNNSVMAVALGTQIVAVSVLDGSGNIVAAGGGNIVAAGGGNLVAAGGGNLVAAGGGNLTGLSASTPGFVFGNTRSVLSTGQKRLPTSGGGSLVLK
jgi:hypothetical protein